MFGHTWLTAGYIRDGEINSPTVTPDLRWLQRDMFIPSHTVRLRSSSSSPADLLNPPTANLFNRCMFGCLDGCLAGCRCSQLGNRFHGCLHDTLTNWLTYLLFPGEQSHKRHTDRHTHTFTFTFLHCVNHLLRATVVHN